MGLFDFLFKNLHVSQLMQNLIAIILLLIPVLQGELSLFAIPGAYDLLQYQEECDIATMEIWSGARRYSKVRRKLLNVLV